jgi:hypothetical protein
VEVLVFLFAKLFCLTLEFDELGFTVVFTIDWAMLKQEIQIPILAIPNLVLKGIFILRVVAYS